MANQTVVRVRFLVMSAEKVDSNPRFCCFWLWIIAGRMHMTTTSKALWRSVRKEDFPEGTVI